MRQLVGRSARLNSDPVELGTYLVAETLPERCQAIRCRAAPALGRLDHPLTQLQCILHLHAVDRSRLELALVNVERIARVVDEGTDLVDATLEQRLPHLPAGFVPDAVHLGIQPAQPRPVRVQLSRKGLNIRLWLEDGSVSPRGELLQLLQAQLRHIIGSQRGVLQTVDSQFHYFCRVHDRFLTGSDSSPGL
ncbi:hypothetical protein ACFYWY_05790 [Streptomyces sp. NPDC002870]|uniref:hypothetical protein n=1 Tax=Streptomyces sp. NPDC002870 TaxID=3364666 RepID=UPI00369BECD7